MNKHIKVVHLCENVTNNVPILVFRDPRTLRPRQQVIYIVFELIILWQTVHVTVLHLYKVLDLEFRCNNAIQVHYKDECSFRQSAGLPRLGSSMTRFQPLYRPVVERSTLLFEFILHYPKRRNSSSMPLPKSYHETRILP